MTDLSKISGLPIELKDGLGIKFNPPLADREFTYERKFSQVQPVLMDQTIKEYEHNVLYTGYRGLALPEHEHIVNSKRLSYDLTIVAPYRIGKEFNKTVGHYHSYKPGTQVAYPELYEILQGEVLILLQKMDPEFKKVLAVLTIKAKAGDKIIYPPNYGHILVNIGKEILVTANWLCLDYGPKYEPVSDRKGMAYYVVADDKTGYNFVPNQNYGEIPPIREMKIENMSHFSIMVPKPMYTTGMIDPSKLDFLINPEKYAVELSAVSS